MPIAVGSPSQNQVQRVLCSVTDKTGLVNFIQNLRNTNPQIEVLASGGTLDELVKANIPCTPIKEYTGFPECFSGRVKTIHPMIEGGILYKRGEHDQEAKALGIKPIDLVVCNLYNFEKAAKKTNAKMEDIIESMDIGGSTLLRSSCKNYRFVAIVVDPKDYTKLSAEFAKNGGKFSRKTHEKLADKAMELSAHYEKVIADTFKKHH